MRGLAIALASFLLTVSLFAGLSRYSANFNRVNTARTDPSTGPVLVRVPEIAGAGQSASISVAHALETDGYERGWISPEVVPVSQDGGLFRRLRPDLD